MTNVIGANLTYEQNVSYGMCNLFKNMTANVQCTWLWQMQLMANEIYGKYSLLQIQLMANAANGKLNLWQMQLMAM